MAGVTDKFTPKGGQGLLSDKRCHSMWSPSGKKNQEIGYSHVGENHVGEPPLVSTQDWRYVMTLAKDPTQSIPQRWFSEPLPLWFLGYCSEDIVSTSEWPGVKSRLIGGSS